MIAVARRGRLGNQLFQFAFGIAAAARLGTSFVMPDDDVRRIFTLGRWASAPGRSFRSLRYRVGHRIRPYPLVDEDAFGSAEELFAALEDRTLYHGFFQSERFFASARGDVLAAFTFRPEHESRLRARYGELLDGPYVCCHVRRTDYHAWEDGIVLPASYYLECLDELAPPHGTPVVFVGDDFEGLRDELGDVPDARFERNDEALDLLLLARAESVVTSNSSFGWWGAYLNGAETGRVFAPRHWLGFKRGQELPRGVVPDSWRQVPVRLPAGAGSRD